MDDVLDVNEDALIDFYLEVDSLLNSDEDMSNDKQDVKMHKYKVQSETLAKLRAKLQIPREGLFDRIDLTWKNVKNQEKGRY